MSPEEVLKAFGVGLTGGVATGKSTVARLLAAKGYVVIDADRLARDVTAAGSPALAGIRAAFGPEMLTAGGELDRKRLGTLVFSDPEARQRLEAITHPRVREALAAALAAHGLLAAPRLFFYEAALLVETKSHDRFRSLWVTSCAADVQLARLRARDGKTADEAARVIAAQMPAAAKALAADVLIDTGGTVEDVERRVDEALVGEIAGRAPAGGPT